MCVEYSLRATKFINYYLSQKQKGKEETVPTKVCWLTTEDMLFYVGGSSKDNFM
jgi:hypothetical protein